VCAEAAAGHLTGPARVVVYTRVSTGEQADSGAGLAAQESQLRVEAEGRGWLIVGLLSDAGASGSSMRKRPALAEALALVDHGQGDVLAVAKLDRLSRSVLDFAQLMVRARDLGWGLVALDLGVDTTTTSGRLVANVMVSVAEWERDIIGQRTREGLAERRAAGVRLGGPQMVPTPIVARIVGGRRAGCTVRGIAAGLTAEGVPTARGGAVWASSSVRPCCGRRPRRRGLALHEQRLCFARGLLVTYGLSCSTSVAVRVPVGVRGPSVLDRRERPEGRWRGVGRGPPHMQVSDRPHASCRRFGGAVELSSRGSRHCRVRRA